MLESGSCERQVLGWGKTSYGKPGTEQGSALILVMMVLLLVTTLAFPLLFVTEIEMLLGGSERVVTGNFYAAETGIHAALGGLLVTQDWAGEKLAEVEGVLAPDRLIGHRVTTSRVQGMGPPQTPPLTVANEGENNFHTFSVVLTSVAQRVSWPEVDPDNPQPPFYDDGDPREAEVAVQAQSSHTAHFFLSPIRAPASAGEVYNDEAIHKLGW